MVLSKNCNFRANFERLGFVACSNHRQQEFAASIKRAF